MNTFTLISLLVATCSAAIQNCDRDIVLDNEKSEATATLADPKVASLSAISAITFCFFVFPFDDVGHALRYIFTLNFPNNNYLAFLSGSYDGSAFVIGRFTSAVVLENFLIPLKQWTHVCVTWNGKSGVVQGYANGTMKYNETTTRTNFVFKTSSSSQFILGNRDATDPESQYFQINKMNVWNRTLTADEVSRVSKCLTVDSGLVVNWENAIWAYNNLAFTKPTSVKCPNTNSSLLNNVNKIVVGLSGALL